MKKIVFMLVSALSLSLPFVGCAQSGNSPSASTNDDSANQERTEMVTEEVGKVAIDNERCAVEVLDKFEVANIAGYHLRLTNKTDGTLLMRIANESLTVGGEKATGSFSEELPSGATVDTTLAVPVEDDEGGTAADKLENVRFTVETVSRNNVADLVAYDVSL